MRGISERDKLLLAGFILLVNCGLIVLLTITKMINLDRH